MELKIKQKLNHSKNQKVTINIEFLLKNLHYVRINKGGHK